MKYLGVDYGLKKIGLAVSEGELASPLKVLHVKSRADAIAQITEVVKGEKINQVVIGAPESGIRDTVLKLVEQLNLAVPIEIVDETLTSQDAKKVMIELGVGRKKRMEEDAYSAAAILQNYLDRKP